jgi:flagellar hook-length control protein FliK
MVLSAIVPGAAEAAQAPAAANVASALPAAVVRELTTAAQGAMTEHAESGAAVRSEPVPSPAAHAAASFASAGHDAFMGGDESSQGQGRPTPGFMRFAAALAQVAPPSSEDRAFALPVATAGTAAAVPAAPLPSVPASVPTAPTFRSPSTGTPDAENVGRLVQAMRINATRSGSWEATVRLKPENFGDVTIALRVERNAVSAVVNAEAASVRQWLESQEQAVRSGMAEHGLQLERFVVQRDGQQRREADTHEQEQPRRRQPRRADAVTERFEVLV